MTDDVQFVDLDWAGRTASIEYQWLARERDGPLVVFLHEGLGSRAMWKDFPLALCDAANVRGLVFSRPGYGKSTPRDPQERWDVDYLHRQAYELLPAFFAALGVDVAKPWLLGHSDGASIALLYASRSVHEIAGLVLLAPHLFVEPLSVASIELTRQAYLDPETELREKLARYHDDVDAVFWRWNHIWLDPRFLAWNIEQGLASIACPVLAVQGLDDEYGTLEQLRALVRHVPQTRTVELADCRHSAHRDQPERLLAEVARFIASPPSARPGRIAAPTALSQEEP